MSEFDFSGGGAPASGQMWADTVELVPRRNEIPALVAELKSDEPAVRQRAEETLRRFARAEAAAFKPSRFGSDLLGLVVQAIIFLALVACVLRMILHGLILLD